MSDETATGPDWLVRSRGGAEASVVAWAIAWCAGEPERVGEVALLPRGKTLALGREVPEGEAIGFRRDRPGESAPARPLTSRGISRRHLIVKPGEGAVEVENVGRHPMEVSGVRRELARVLPGDTLLIEDQLVLLCTTRPARSAWARRPPPEFALGEPDPHGLVGESPAVWALRDQLVEVGRAHGHVLVTGPSGAGKELVARALHRLSPRSGGPFVARNAATLPSGVVDAELFGNAKNYPNAGMAERGGLLGEAHGGTLFLDEIGELPQETQARLLRALDDGDYHRLGEGAARRANLRAVGATNRSVDSLKHDFAARFPLRVELPGLDERREDIPLLAAHLLRQAASRDPSLRRFFDGAAPRLDPLLVEGLLRHQYTTHVRELGRLLFSAIGGSKHGYIALTDDVQEALAPVDVPSADGPSEQAVRQALAKHAGNVSRAWQELGLRDRHALYRLMRKLGISR